MSEIESTTPAVVAKLVAGHREFLRFLERRVGDRALAEDILQEAFVRGVARADEIREETAVAWFYRTLRNAVIDHYRRRGASARALGSLADEMAGAEEPAPEVKGAICHCVAELAGTLKPEYAQAIRRIEVDGVAVKDFAAEAGITASNAAVRVFRAREALRKQVAKSCGSCAEHGCLECSCGKPGGGCKPVS
jgi:RNA polymerase sigma factor (sigma-70 family)